MKKEVTDEKAKALGAIKKVEIDGENGDKYIFYLKKPHRTAVGYALAKEEINPIEASEILANACVIQEISDYDALQDDSVFYTLRNHLGTMTDLKKSQSKML